jgi:autophagy-related protein 13
MPAIPSRLSANSIIDYTNRNAAQGAADGTQESQVRYERQRESDTVSPRGTGAIDIPTSPRFYPSYRRSSSVSQQHRLYDEEFTDGGGYNRRASMGDRGERQAVPMTELMNMNEGSSGTGNTAQRQQDRLGDDTAMSRQRSTDSHKSQDDESPLSPRGMLYRPRIGRGSGRGVGSSHGSSTSLAEKGVASGTSDQRTSRYSFTRPGNFEDEEPLLFAMSDFNPGQQGRRSLEDNSRGSGPADLGGSGESTSQRGGRRGGRGWAQD